MKTLFTLLALALGLSSAQVPILTPYPKQIQVSTTSALVSALATAQKGTAIMLADGTYSLASVWPLRIRTDSIMLYGASRNPSKVILKGNGFTAANRDEELCKIEAKAITIAYLTFSDGRGNGLKIQSGGNDDMMVHNVTFRDICERSIKGPEVPVSRRGIVQYCLFEQVQAISLSIPNLQDSGNYCAGMDMMRIEDWTIRDNVFKGIRGRTGGGRAAIFCWNLCKRITIERNVFTGCDRSIALGNSLNTNPGMDSGFIRNNFISAGKDISFESWNNTGNLITGNQIIGTPSYYRTLSLGNNGPNVMRGNIVQGKISLISGQMPDTAGNLWITDVAITGAITAPKADTVTKVVQLPAPPPDTVRITIQLPAIHDTIPKPYPVPGPVVTITDTLPRVCPLILCPDPILAQCVNLPQACPAIPVPTCPACPVIPPCPTYPSKWIMEPAP